MSHKLNPDMLAFLDAERQFTEMRGGGKVRRVKIEKVNQAWLVRFLPVALGESGLFFVRQGQHWYNKIPIVCPRNVSPDFGGDENAECVVCDLADRLNAEDHEEVSTFGFKLRVNPVWLTYCLVFQIDPGRGEVQDMLPAEYMRPWEFVMYKGTFDELSDYFRRGKTATRELSVLDPKKGNDFWATKTTKGIRLDRQDPGPMFELGPTFEKQLNQVLSAVQEPKIIIPTAKQLETYARKAEAAAYGESEPEPTARSRSRGRGVEGEEEPQERPSRNLGRTAPAGRGTSRTQTEPEPEPEAEPQQEGQAVDDQIPEEGAPEPVAEVDAPVDAIAAEQDEDQVPGAEVDAPTTRQAPRTSPGRVAQSTSQPVAQRTAPRPAPAAVAATRPALVATRPAAPAVPAAATAGTRRPPPAAAPVTRRPAPAAAPVQETVNDEEDPGVAEEAVDAAAPAEEPLPDDSQEDVPPPAVARTAPRPGQAAAGATAALRSKLAQRITSANSPR